MAFFPNSRVLLDTKKITVLSKQKIITQDLTVTQVDYMSMADIEQVPKFNLGVMKDNN